MGLISEMFMIFNISGDGSMSKMEFSFCYHEWITKIINPTSAFLVVDIQNDFITGTLSSPKASEVKKRIKKHVR